jgi:hypothetical protein
LGTGNAPQDEDEQSELEPGDQFPVAWDIERIRQRRPAS